jgi:hypothetical protein
MVPAAVTLTLALNSFFERTLSISDRLTQPFPRYAKHGLSKKLGGGPYYCAHFLKSGVVQSVDVEQIWDLEKIYFNIRGTCGITELARDFFSIG